MSGADSRDLGDEANLYSWLRIHIPSYSVVGIHISGFSGVQQQHPTLLSRNGFCRTFSHLPIKSGQLKKWLQFNAAAAAWGLICLISQVPSIRMKSFFVDVFRQRKKSSLRVWRAFSDGASEIRERSRSLSVRVSLWDWEQQS